MRGGGSLYKSGYPFKWAQWHGRDTDLTSLTASLAYFLPVREDVHIDGPGGYSFNNTLVRLLSTLTYWRWHMVGHGRVICEYCCLIFWSIFYAALDIPECMLFKPPNVLSTHHKKHRDVP